MRNANDLSEIERLPDLRAGHTFVITFRELTTAHCNGLDTCRKQAFVERPVQLSAHVCHLSRNVQAPSTPYFRDGFLPRDATPRSAFRESSLSTIGLAEAGLMRRKHPL
jgi:hypothetical protein